MTDEKKPNRIIPNAYQSPNFYVDDLLPLLSGEEWKCMSFLIRKTLGWQKFSDRLARSVICASTGLSEATVDKCMANLIEFGLALRVDGNNAANEGVEYGVQMDDEKINFDMLEKRKQEIAEKNFRRTEAARAASLLKMKEGSPVSQGSPVTQGGGGDVAQGNPYPVRQGTQKPIKTNLNLGADAQNAKPQPPAEWGAAWALAAGTEYIPITEEQQQAIKLENAVQLFQPIYQPLARAFILATGIFPLEKQVSGWSLSFKDQMTSTGLDPEDVSEACKQMLKDRLTIKDPFSVMNKVPNIRSARKQKQAASAQPWTGLQTEFARALDSGNFVPKPPRPVSQPRA